MSDMCYAEVMGGLGNQMFIIAAAYAHAKRNGLTLAIGAVQSNKRPFYFDSFLLNCRQYTLGVGVGVGVNSESAPAHVWSEPHFHFAEIPANARRIFGYFQSSKYFKGYENELRTLFDPPDSIKDAVHQKYGDILNQKEQLIAVHVRRGDYYTATNTAFHGIDSKYFSDAMTAMTESSSESTSNFLVFSDDIAWCKQNLHLPPDGVRFVDEPDECLSLWLMSQFPRIIISNSSFSWWATFLGNQPKTVIAPSKWFGPAGPQDWHDIYEESWRVITL